MRSKRCLWLCLFALCAVPLSAAPIVPPSAEFRVNQTVISKQRHPVSAFDASGRVLVVWENDKIGLQGRFFGKDGRALGSELTLVANSGAPQIPFRGDVSERRDPAILFLPAGNFYLFWSEDVTALRLDHFFESRRLKDRDVFGQLFDRNGVASRARFRVNAGAAGFQSVPVVLSRTSDFIVVWSAVDGLEGTEGDGVFARVFERSGTPAGGDFKISTGLNPAIAGDAAGKFLVAWDASDGDGQGIFARLFNAGGAPVGGELRVSTDTVGNQRRATVAAGKAGEYLVAWQGQFQQPKSTRIYGQVVGAAGNLLGGQLALSTGIGELEIAPAAASGRGGSYLVAWLGYEDIFPFGIFGLEVDDSGNPTGEEVKVNRRGMGANTRTALSGDGKGGFALSWQGFIQREQGISAQVVSQ